MAYLLVRHKVKDFSEWKSGFDAHASFRKKGGSKGGYLFRNEDDPNEVIVVLKWDDLEKARTFANSEELKKTMEKVGVIDKPDIYFLDEVERPSV